MRTIYSVLTVTVLLGVGFVGAADGVEEGGTIEGKVSFEAQKCSMCHGVAAVGIEAKTTSDKMKGPDLSGYESEVPFAKLAPFLRGESMLEDRKHMKPFKGTDEELQAIIDWLGSLEAQK